MHESKVGGGVVAGSQDRSTICALVDRVDANLQLVSTNRSTKADLREGYDTSCCGTR